MKGDQPQIGVLVGVDVGKERHRAQALTADGEPLFEGSVGNDPAAVEELLDQAGRPPPGRNIPRWWWWI